VAQNGAASAVAEQLSNTVSGAVSRGRARQMLTGLPLIFEPNQGQGSLDPADARARFVSRGAGYSLFLGQQGAILSLVTQRRAGQSNRSAALADSLEMKLAGANASATLSAEDRLPGHSNYFIGNDPSKWRTGVPQFGRVRYENVYPGINLVFYGNQGHLEYDFQVAPGADPGAAELEFAGAKKVEVEDGALVVRGEKGSVKLQPPVVYQQIAGQRQAVEGSFVLRGHNRAGFRIGAYDRSRELVIDPILTFSTYFGGTGDELASSVAVDGSFNIYLTGSTTSPSLPGTTGYYQTGLNGTQNIYIAKITPPQGSVAPVVDYVTYIGGNGQDTPVGIQVDGGMNAYVAGTTTSTNFPTTATNAYQSLPQTVSLNTSHVFVTKLSNVATTLLYSSYLSGNNTDAASGMTIDSGGDIYVTGTTYSTDSAGSTIELGSGGALSTTDEFPASTLPEQLAYQSSSLAAIQFFVTKVDTNRFGTASIVYSTYFGGAQFNAPSGTTLPTVIGGGIAVDSNGNIYFSGGTNFVYTGTSSNTDFHILNAYQPCLDQAPPTEIVTPVTCKYSTTTPPTSPDAFVAKINPSAEELGEQLQWSTYLGGTQTDYASGVALDPGAANVYVVGSTNSQDFVTSTTLATFGPLQECLNDMPATPAGGSVTCSTQTNPAPYDAFVARLTNPTSSSTTTNMVLNYFSYLGGSDDDYGLAIAVDNQSGALVTGSTVSPDLPVLNCSSIQCSLYCTPTTPSVCAQDAFLARVNTAAVTGQNQVGSWEAYWGGTVNSSGAVATGTGTGVALDVNQNSYFVGDTNAASGLQLDEPLSAAQGGQYNGGYDAYVAQFKAAVSATITGVLTLGSSQTYISAGNPATFTYTITNTGADPANDLVITDNLSTAATGIPVTFVSATVSSGQCTSGLSSNTSISCGPISLQPSSTATLTITVTPTSSTSCTQNCSNESFNGGTVQVLSQGSIVLAETSVSANMSDYNMSVSPLNQSVAQAGDTAPYQVQLTPSPLYSSSISLSCSNLPASTKCNFNPNGPVSLQSSSGQTVALSIVTTARPITTAALVLPRRFYAVWLAVPGLALFGVGSSRNRRRMAGLLILCWILSLVALLPACTHTQAQQPVSGTPAGNYNIQVTAASGTDSKTQTVGLSVP
jgi:uncharacterized repeat protein (TIGR01451 family)